MSKGIVIFLIIILVILGGYFLLTGEDTMDTPDPQDDTVVENGENAENGEEEMDENGEEEMEEEFEEAREIVISSGEFSFSPSEIVVTEGERVRIVFENEGEMLHDWVVEGTDIATEIIPAGSSDVIEFTAPEAGTYATFCSVGNHRLQGMEGTLVVEPSQ